MLNILHTIIEINLSTDNSSNNGLYEEFPALKYSNTEEYDVCVSKDYVDERGMCADEFIQEKENKDIRTVMSEFSATPYAISLPQAGYTDLFRRFFRNPHIFAEGQLDNLWKTGKGLTQIPQKFYAHIIFRNLLEYRPETDDFPPPPAPPKVKPKKKSKSCFVIPDDPLLSDCGSDSEESLSGASFCSVSDGEKAAVESDIELSENEDRSSCSSGDEADDDEELDKGDVAAEKKDDDDEAKDPNYKGDGGQIRVADLDIGGVEDQIAYDAINNRDIQEMAYFGIEKVLTGVNPGILDYQGYSNVLKAMAVLNDTTLSDALVVELFKKSPIKVSYLICTIYTVHLLFFNQNINFFPAFSTAAAG
jgi:hypothetical protein